MKYDVYGIGNALVDKEFEIEDDFLKEFSIEKGMMTLVDREQQDQLLSELTRRYGVKTRSGGGVCGEHPLCHQPVRRQRILLVPSRQ